MNEVLILTASAEDKAVVSKNTITSVLVYLIGFAGNIDTGLFNTAAPQSFVNDITNESATIFVLSWV